MTDYESVSQADAGIRRVWLIEAVDGSIMEPEWYESEADAREAAPDVTGHGDDWETCWRVTSFVRRTECRSIAPLEPEEAQMLIDLAEHSLAGNEPTEAEETILGKLAAMAGATDYGSVDGGQE